MKYKLLLLLIILRISVVSFGQLNFSFYAVYDRLLDSRVNSFQVYDYDFSGDGRTIVVVGEDKLYGNTVMFTLGFDGSNMQEIELPEAVESIRCMGVDSAGSAAFFYASPSIYRMEIVDGTITEIFNVSEEVGQISPNRMVVSGDGNSVFFRSDGGYNTGTIMRINRDGSDPEVVVDYHELIRDGGYAGGLQQYFSVSHDGSRIAFIMAGYFGDNGYKTKAELFLKDGTGYHQLTNEGVITSKYHAYISGDGETIVFSEKNTESLWFSIKSDGTERKPIAVKGFNFPGLDITYDGRLMIHGEGSGNGGCLVATNGSYNRELFSSVYLMFNHYSSDIKLSDDGSKVCFLYSKDIDGEKTRALYLGHFNNPFAVPDAPVIEYIEVSPSTIPDTPDKPLVLTARVSDPQGFGDINKITCNELVEGRKLSSSYVPVYFGGEPKDDGELPDVTAGDGVFSCDGETRNIVDQFTRAEIRIGVMDQSLKVVVADTLFEISNTSSISSSDKKFMLIRPNPVQLGEELFFSIPGGGFSSLEIYDIRGVCLHKCQLTSPTETVVYPTDSFIGSEGIYIYKLSTPEGSRSGLLRVIGR